MCILSYYYNLMQVQLPATTKANIREAGADIKESD